MPIHSKLLFPALLSIALVLGSCQTGDLFEKVAPIPGHDWNSSYKPSFTFRITDTASAYRVYIIVRHNAKYNYNNIWLNLTSRMPGDTAASKTQFELPLANSEGWINADAMDDLYDHRIPVTPAEGLRFRKAGEYTYTLEHIMRENPLRNVLNVGIRIEKLQPR